MARHSGNGTGDFAALQRRLAAFRDERNWEQFHSLSDLAASIGIEAAELAELFLWVPREEEDLRLRERRSEIEAELADIVIQCLNFANAAQADLAAAINAKIQDNERRYPVDRTRGSAAKYTAYTEAYIPPNRMLKPLIVEALESLGGEGHRQRIIRSAVELGEFTHEQMAVPPSVGKRASYSSEIEYRLSWALTHAGKDGMVQKLGRGMWRLREGGPRPGPGRGSTRGSTDPTDAQRTRGTTRDEDSAA